jgi:hypothetical protein
MIKINYESDFKLTEKFEERLVGIPFKFVYATNSGTYTASYDGEAYTNCKRNEDGSITIIFNKHGLGVGKLKVRREFFVPDEDFPDGVYNIVSNDTTDIMLVEGKTDNTDVEEEFNPPYIEGGGEVVSVEIVDSLDSDASDKALSARQGKELKGMIPTKVSGLENDEGYITEIPEGYATKDDVSEAIAEIDMVTPIVNQTQLTVEIQPNVLNVWGEVRYLELTFADAEEGKANEYMAQFTSGETATTLVLPSTIVWLSEPNIQANKIYQLSVINNLGVIGEFSNE